MIVQTLVSRSLFRQLLLMLLVLTPAIITVVLKGVNIFIPEDATVYYQRLAAWVGSLPSIWLEAVVLGFYAALIFSLYRLSRVPGFYLRSSRSAPLFLALLGLFLFPENLGLHPTLVALVLLIPAIRNILLCGDALPSHSRLFNAGFFVALATLFSFPIILFLPSFFIVLFVFRLYRWNYSGMFAVGVLLPWIYAMLGGWLTGLYPLQELYGQAGIWLSGFMFVWSYINVLFTFTHYLAISLMILFLISAFWAVYSKLDQRLVGVRYLYRSVMWLSVPGILYAIVSGGMVIQALMVFVFFMMIIGTTYLREIKHPIRLNVLLWSIIISMIVSHLR
jgi:hypothetical protein